MTLFTRKRKAEQQTLASLVGGVVDRVHPIASAPLAMSAGDAARHALPIAHQYASNVRLFLVLSGAGLDLTGRCGEWQFHFVYPDNKCESILTVASANRSPVPGTPTVREEITPWPPPGSTQEAMLLYQGTTAKLIIEEQWMDRLQRLPGLPESFIDSTDAIAAVHSLGVDMELGGTNAKMKGRTPPGRSPVWEIVDGVAVYHTPFA